jgi:diguanylate cyclase (GGDEF)-like protein
MVAYWNADQICEFCNKAYLHWFGKNRVSIIGTSMRDLLGPLYEKNLPYINAAFAGQKQVFERAIPFPDGQGVRHSLATYYPHVVDGQVKGIFAHVADVSPLKKLEEELKLAKERAEQMATHDFLTGLINRAALGEVLGKAISQARRQNKMVAVFSVDLDNFKIINDTFGHDAGDQFLVAVAKRLQRAMRDYDIVARLGGDEFVLAATGIESLPQVETIANRILALVHQPLRVLDTDMEPSLSIGVALYPAHGESVSALVQSSDKALYLAKNQGRNRFLVLP